MRSPVRTSLLAILVAISASLSSRALAEIGADVIADIRARSTTGFVAINADACLQPVEYPPPDPDRNGGGSLVNTGFRAVTEVMFHGRNETNGLENAGIISYMGASVLSNDRFFTLAYRFYLALHERDQAMDRGSRNFLNPIEESTAFDVHALALTTAQGNPYVALRLMTVFGHDDASHDLRARTALSPGEQCRIRALNKIKPPRNSTLFLQGALAGISYTSDEVRRGGEIARDCARIPDFSIRSYCNDNQEHYLADYYHVNVGAFFGCRLDVVNRMDTRRFSLNLVSAESARATYLDQVRSYKLDRFEERTNLDRESALLHRIADNTRIVSRLSPRDRVRRGELQRQISELRAELRILVILRDGLARLRARQAPSLQSFARVCSRNRCTRAEYQSAGAILRRYEFETDFRVEQHRRGMEFGRRACQGMTSLEMAPPQISAHCP